MGAVRRVVPRVARAARRAGRTARAAPRRSGRPRPVHGCLEPGVHGVAGREELHRRVPRRAVRQPAAAGRLPALPGRPRRDLDQHPLRRRGQPPARAWPRRSCCTPPSSGPGGRAGSGSCRRRSSRSAATRCSSSTPCSARRCSRSSPPAACTRRCAAWATRRSWAWPALAGVALAGATSVRVVGMATIVIVCVWLAFGASGALRRRLATAGVAALGALAVLSSYWIAEYATTGAVGMSRNGDYHLYGRVAPFADCTKFTPPRGTEMLCETKPRSERPITDAYIFSYWHSPAVRAFGSPFEATPQASGRVGDFARAVVIGQPRRLPDRGRRGDAALRRARVRLAAQLRRRARLRGADRQEHPAQPELPQPRDRLAPALLRVARERLREALGHAVRAAPLRALSRASRGCRSSCSRCVVRRAAPRARP